MRRIDQAVQRLAGRRVKWEPVLAMVLLLLLGLWLVSGPNRIEPREGAWASSMRIGAMRGIVELLPTGETGPDGRPAHEITLRYREAPAVGPMTDAQFRERFGERAYERLMDARGNVLFALLNITTWGGVVWVVVGLGGQAAFFGRMLIQWVASEKSRASVVPEAFWWLSLFGGVALFTYFVWRQDAVGVLGQTTGVVIYARNLRLIAKRRQQDRERAARRAAKAQVDRTLPMDDAAATDGAGPDPQADPSPEPVDEGRG